MVSVVGVQFDHAGKLYYFDPNDLELPVGSTVLVETANGQELGQVLAGKMEIDDEALSAPLRPVLRLATPQDLAREAELQEKSKSAFTVCREKIRAHQLDMKLISAKYMFDGSKILFCFTADERVDFRALVRDLSASLRSRVELRQVGPRDEARMKGGVGACGRIVCCRSFLHDFQTVSIKAAKDQNLALNPTKISGICGKLMCCLKYEQEAYVEAHKRMPRVGRAIETPEGNGTVTEINVLRETVKVRIPKGDGSEVREFALAALAGGKPEEPAAEAPKAVEAPGPDDQPEAAAAEPEAPKPPKPAPVQRPAKQRPPKQQAARPAAEGGQEKEPQQPKAQQPKQRPQPVARTNPKAAQQKKPAAPAQQPAAPKPVPVPPAAPAPARAEEAPAPAVSKQSSWRKALEDAKRAARQSE